MVLPAVDAHTKAITCTVGTLACLHLPGKLLRTLTGFARLLRGLALSLARPRASGRAWGSCSREYGGWDWGGGTMR